MFFPSATYLRDPPVREANVFFLAQIALPRRETTPAIPRVIRAINAPRGAKEAVDLFTRREFVGGQRAETRKQTQSDLPRFRPPEG